MEGHKPASTWMMLSLAGLVLVKVSSSALLAAQLQKPICSWRVLAKRTEQSLLAFPKAGNERTARAGPSGLVDDVTVVTAPKDTSFAAGVGEAISACDDGQASPGVQRNVSKKMFLPLSDVIDFDYSALSFFVRVRDACFRTTHNVQRNTPFYESAIALSIHSQWKKRETRVFGAGNI